MPKQNSLIFITLLVVSLLLFGTTRLLAQEESASFDDTGQTVPVESTQEYGQKQTTPEYAEKAFKYSKTMNEVRNSPGARSKRLQALINAEHEHNTQLLNQELNTETNIKGRYSNLTQEEITSITKLVNLSISTRTAYSLATEGMFKILYNLNTYLDNLELSGFDVTLYVSQLEEIEDMIINANANAEAIVFQLPNSDTITKEYKISELTRVGNSLNETKTFYATIQNEIIKLIYDTK